MLIYYVILELIGCLRLEFSEKGSRKGVLGKFNLGKERMWPFRDVGMSRWKIIFYNNNDNNKNIV